MPKKLIKLVKGKQNFPKCKTQPDCDLKIQLNGKRLFETDSVKCLRIQIDRRLTWKQQINHVALKLNKASAMLSKLRHVLDIKTLEFHLCYTSLIWVQNINSVKRLHLLQKILSEIYVLLTYAFRQTFYSLMYYCNFHHSKLHHRYFHRHILSIKPSSRLHFVNE